MTAFAPVAGHRSSPTTAPGVSVVVCAYTPDRWDDLQAAVDSVCAQNTPPEQVVIVIDHHPGLLAAAQARFAEQIVVANRYGRGLSGARNTGVESASGEIVAFIDDDARARPGWLEALTAPFADPTVLGVGGGVVPAWNDRQPRWLPSSFLWVVGCSYQGLPTEVAPIRNPIGANMAFRRSVLTEVGGFSEGLGRVGRLPLGCEETELSIRATAAYPGTRNLYVPVAQVDHRVPAERGRWSYFTRRCYSEGLSKARVSELAGAGSGLASERTHAFRVLPLAVLRPLQRVVLHAEPSGMAEAAAVVVGTVAVGLGLVAGMRARQGSARPLPVTGESPTCVVDYRLDRSPPPIPASTPDGRPYRRAVVLVRDGRYPTASVSLELPQHGDPGQLVAAVRSELAARPPRPARGDRSVPLEPVSVVIATRNRPEALDRCLASLRDVDHPDVEIIVVDNGPSAATRSVAANHDSPGRQVRYLMEARRGASRARNRGIALSTRPIVAVTDDDVVADPGWLSALCEPFALDPEVACVTGLVMPSHLDTDAQLWFEHWGGFAKGYERTVFDRDQSRGASPLYPYSPGAYGSGNNVAYRTEVIRARGGYDVALGPGTPTCSGEELDVFFNLVTHGHRVVYEPSALVWHHHRTSDEELLRQLHDYGVGLSALMLKWSVKSPQDMTALAQRIPAVARAFRGAHARPTSNAAPGAAARTTALPQTRLPRAMRRAEQLGMLQGPGAYRTSRRQARRLQEVG